MTVKDVLELAKCQERICIYTFSGNSFKDIEVWKGSGMDQIPADLQEISVQHIYAERGSRLAIEI